MESSTPNIEFARKPALIPNLRPEQSVRLCSNYMKIRMRSNERPTLQYSLHFLPEVAAENDTLRRHLFSAIRSELRLAYHPYIVSGDTLFSPNSSTDEERVFTISWNDEGADPVAYQLTVRKTNNTIDLASLTKLDNASLKKKALIEIIVKNILNAHKGMVRFNKSSIFNYQNAKRIQDPENAFLMPGYASNAVITDCGLFLRVVSKNKFINGKTCYQRFLELAKDNKNGNLIRALKEEFIGKSIMATYGNHKVYIVDDVSESTPANRTMPWRTPDGKVQEITLVKYYKEQYKKTLEHPDSFMLISNTKKNANRESIPLYLIPELFYMTGMDETMISNEAFKKNMTERTKLVPRDRMNNITAFKGLLEMQNSRKQTRIDRRTGEEVTIPDPNDIRNEWGLEIADFKEFTGRVLSPPEIVFDRKQVSEVNGGKFRDKNFIQPVHLTSSIWAAVCSSQNINAAQDMIKGLQNCSRNLGVNVDPPEIISHNERRPADLIDFLKSKDLTRYRVILVVLDRFTKTKAFYEEIKNYFYCNSGIHCQVVLKENSSKNLSYYSNVLKQIQSKIGARPYQIMLDKTLFDNPSMIIGYDCSKHGKGGKQRKFVMSASYDQYCSKPYTQEIVVDYDNNVGPVSILLRKCLDFFGNLYKGTLPANLIIYRSGINDSEKIAIFNTEVASIINLLSGDAEKDCYKSGYKSKFCFVVVNKRTESKFFEMRGDNLNNPTSGTVIDTQVTTPGAYEFYLQPQFVNSGTATPTHFHCLFDSTGIPLEILESVTYKSCYYYWNWPGAIREPALLKFAEVANKFHTTYLRSEVRENLKNCPYYI